MNALFFFFFFFVCPFLVFYLFIYLFIYCLLPFFYNIWEIISYAPFWQKSCGLNILIFFLFPRPPPYDYPSEDPIGVSTYKANFRETNFPRQGPHPTSPLRKNNPHPKTMTNAFNYPNRVSFSLDETEDFFLLGWREGNYMVFRGEGWGEQSRPTE